MCITITAAVGAKHYLMVTEEDDASAIDPDLAPSVDPLVDPSQGELGPPQEIKQRKNPRDSGVLMTAAGVRWEPKYTRQDSNLQPSVPKTKQAFLMRSGCLRKPRVSRGFLFYQISTWL